MFSELWEPPAGFTVGADKTGWRTDRRLKVDVGRPERRQWKRRPGRWDIWFRGC